MYADKVNSMRHNKWTLLLCRMPAAISPRVNLKKNVLDKNRVFKKSTRF